MQQTLLFPPPAPPRRRYSILPVFLPFSGCPQRCVFCAQDIQTGQSHTSVFACLAKAEKELEALASRFPAVSGVIKFPSASSAAGFRELAFFGGTFTMLREEDLAACLRFAAYWKGRGLVDGLRCSTRPDALTPVILDRLAQAGFTCVELGVQSFSVTALTASRRGYDGETAVRGCEMVKASGMALGIQLLPGMPGHCLDDALADVRQSVVLAPDCVRLYPCLVLAGTELERLWRAGKYTPWDLEMTVDFLARACGEFQRAGIPVIRMGLAEEPGLEGNVLAGPRHPAIGGMARSRALYVYIRSVLEAYREAECLPGLPADGEGGIVLFAPRAYQGGFWGHAGELTACYSALGLPRERVRWWDEDSFGVCRITPESLPPGAASKI